MQIILPHDHYDPEHLDSVVSEMRTLGTPTIKAVYMPNWDAWVALEGSHRIRAAAALGLTPVIDEVEWSDTLTTDEVVPGSYQDCWTIEQICDDAHTREMVDFAGADA